MKLIELVPKELQDKYGKVFMGHAHDMAIAQKGSPEANTRNELHIQHILQKWVQSARAALDPWVNELYSYFPDIKKIVDENPELRVPAGTTIYRGATVKDENLWNQILSDNGSPVDTLKYSPRRNKVQSWTTNKRIAEEFCLASTHGLKLELINKISAIAKDPEYKYLFNAIDTGRAIDIVARIYESILRSGIVLPIHRDKEYKGLDPFEILNIVVSTESNHYPPYSFPVIVSYEVTASDYVLFPNNLLYSIMDGQTVNMNDDNEYEYDETDKFESAFANEEEVLFFNVPDIKFPIKI